MRFNFRMITHVSKLGDRVRRHKVRGYFLKIGHKNKRTEIGMYVKNEI